MSVNLLVECLTQSNGVLLSVICGRGLITVMEPEVNPIEEVETGPVGNAAPAELIVGPKKDCGCEDSLEALDDAAVVTAVLG